MIINANEIKNETVLRTEICIVGSGIGGSVLAKYLDITNLEVMVVEAGGFERSREPFISHETIGMPFGLRSTRAIQVGGTSNLWHGVLAPLDEIDFEQRAWIDGSGWPINKRSLEPFYQEASVFFGVNEPKYFSAGALPESIRKLLNDMNFDGEVLENKLFQQPLPPKNLSDDLRELCKKNRRFSICYNATALELQGDNGVVNSLVCGSSKTKFIVRASIFVVCAGALESPRLLLNSKWPNGNSIGNSTNLVGKYLMDHPMGNLAQIEFLGDPKKAHIYADMKINKSNKIKTGLVLKKHIQRDLGLPNHNFYLRPSFVRGIDNKSEKVKLSLLTFRDGGVSFSDAVNLFKNLNIVFQIVSYRFALNPFYRFADLFFVTEQIPNVNSYVGLSREVDSFGYQKALVNWQLHSKDFESMNVYYDLLREKGFNEMNCGFVHNKNDIDWPSVLTSAAHHVGTLRMGATKANGVVDKDLRCFETENLFVCDGSVFTTSGNVNSGLTIAALAIRLADHIAKKHSSSDSCQ